MERDIIQVIDNIIEIVPIDREVFISRLNAVKKSACYKAPEIMSDCWATLGEVFCSHVPHPATEEWQKNAVEALTGRPYAL